MDSPLMIGVSRQLRRRIDSPVLDFGGSGSDYNFTFLRFAKSLKIR